MRVLFLSKLPRPLLQRRHFTGSSNNLIRSVLRSSVDLLVDSEASVGCWSGTAELLLPPSLPAQY